MENKVQKIRIEIRNLVEKLTEKLSDAEYIEVLEEIECDIYGMIDCKKEEIDGE